MLITSADRCTPLSLKQGANEASDQWKGEKARFDEEAEICADDERGAREEQGENALRATIRGFCHQYYTYVHCMQGAYDRPNWSLDLIGPCSLDSIHGADGFSTPAS